VIKIRFHTRDGWHQDSWDDSKMYNTHVALTTNV
jgi:hypothetical protein